MASSSPVIVDDADPRILYSPGWEAFPTGGVVDGTKHGATEAGLTATFTFTGELYIVLLFPVLIPQMIRHPRIRRRPSGVHRRPRDAYDDLRHRRQRGGDIYRAHRQARYFHRERHLFRLFHDRRTTRTGNHEREWDRTKRLLARLHPVHSFRRRAAHLTTPAIIGSPYLSTFQPTSVIVVYFIPHP